jgi:hypothetical protein
MIRLRVLGALDLRNSEGQELRAVLSQPKRAALLVYLALARPAVPTGAIPSSPSSGPNRTPSTPATR